MALKKRDLIFAAAFILSTALFFAVKLYSPKLIENLYNAQSFDILNKILGIDENRSLDYYLGDIEIALFGPLKSLISGGLFLSFCLLYMRRATSLQFGLAVFIYLITTRFEVLFNPPFGEGITGPFSDAIWLVQNKLNYIGLLHQETVMTGGPQIYPTSLYTLFLAALITILPSAVSFLVTMHLLTFAMAAFVIAILRKMSLAVLSDRMAIATALATLFLPIFQCMAELLNLEMPSLFFAMLCTYFLLKNRIAAASIAALASLFTKDPGIICCAAVFIVGLKLFFVKPVRPDRRKILYWMIGMSVIAIAKTVLRSIIIGEQKVYAMVCFLCGWQNLRTFIWFWIYVITLVILIVEFLKWRRQQSFLGDKGSPQINKFFIPWLTFWEHHPQTILMFLMAGLWFALFNNFLTFTYRYELLLLPFVVFCVSYGLRFFLKKERLAYVAITTIAIGSLICSHGLAFGASRFTACFPTHLERSLEYRNVLKLEKMIAKEIETNFSNFSIASPFQVAQLLAIPELGYVTKKLDVTVYSMPATLGIKPFTGLKDLDLLKTIWIGYPHHQLDKVSLPYPIDPHDKILKRLRVGHVEVVLFMGGTAVERIRILVEMWQRGLIGK